MQAACLAVGSSTACWGELAILNGLSQGTATHCLSERRGREQPQHSSRTPALPSGQGKTCHSKGPLCRGSNRACRYHARVCCPRICQKRSNRAVSPGSALPYPGPWCPESQRRCHRNKNPGSCSSPQLEPRLAQQLVQGLESVGRNSRIPLLKIFSVSLFVG
jgi:hypothetical protein